MNLHKVKFAVNMYFILTTILLCAQGANEKARPRFEDFKVSRIYEGKPALPKIPKGFRQFRTRIRQGAKAPVEFAGHYTIPSWGMGAGCNVFVIVDSLDGTLYGGFGICEVEKFPEQTDESGHLERMEYRKDSRLLKLNACINEKDCGYYDFEMVDGQGLKLIRKQLLPKEYQPEN
jgi:hypothetical protein